MWSKPVTVCAAPSLRLCATEWSRQGLPCVLLHGLGEAGCVWSHLAFRLAARFRVVAFDLRGHGNSDRDPDGRYEMASFVGDLRNAVTTFGFDRMVLVGHSLGAEIAIRFAAENPARVAALVIVDFGPECGQAGIDEVLRGLAALPRAFASPEDYAQWLIERRPLADPALLRQFARYNLRRADGAETWEPKSDAALAAASPVAAHDPVDGRYRWLDLWPILRRIDCPSLVVRGMASGVLPGDVAQRMADETLRRGRLITVAGAGHAVMMDNPNAFSAGVGGFLAGLAA
ncbi:MAG TPA: alpha/beta hydrolase [Stellaceae bacterium]|nr:alpha/beta hydrolase [Stellaceae bacterium]